MHCHRNKIVVIFNFEPSCFSRFLRNMRLLSKVLTYDEGNYLKQLGRIEKCKMLVSRRCFVTQSNLVRK